MRIVLATDGSHDALTASRLLARLPLPADTFVTVVTAVPLCNWLEAPLLVETEDGEHAAARYAVEHAAAPLRERGVKVVFEICQGDPATAILERANAGAADLIVLGSRGKGKVERFLVGSVSERVACRARCSVLVVRGGSLRKVVVGIDDSEASEHALDALADLPLPAATEIKVVHVIPPEEPFPPPLVRGVEFERVMEAFDRERLAAAERTVRNARERLRAASRTVTTEIRCGVPAEELVAGARAADAGILVVGASNRSPIDRLLLGSVSTRVLRRAGCSVLVARSPVERVRIEEPFEEAGERLLARTGAREPVLS